MSRMLKYPFVIQAGVITISMPVGSTIRAVGVQSPGEICLWASVPQDRPDVQRAFRVVPTGGELPAEGNYVGVAFDGPFVWHIIEVAS